MCGLWQQAANVFAYWYRAVFCSNLSGWLVGQHGREGGEKKPEPQYNRCIHIIKLSASVVGKPSLIPACGTVCLVTSDLGLWVNQSGVYCCWDWPWNEFQMASVFVQRDVDVWPVSTTAVCVEAGAALMPELPIDPCCPLKSNKCDHQGCPGVQRSRAVAAVCPPPFSSPNISLLSTI